MVFQQDEPQKIVQRKGYIPYFEAVKEQKFIDKYEKTGDAIRWGWYDKEGNKVIGSEL